MLEVYRVLGLKVLGFGVWVLKVLGFMMKVWVPQPYAPNPKHRAI